MPSSDRAAPGQVCPGIRIHVIDIVQPPGIGIPMAGMDADHRIVRAALAMNSTAETAKKACFENRSETISCIALSLVAPRKPLCRSALVILVVTAPPGTRFVAPPGRPVEPLVHTPDAVHSARIGGIGVVDDVVFKHERADARPLAHVGARVGSAHGSELGRGPLAVLFSRTRLARCLAPVVVFDASLTLLFLAEPDAIVRIEVPAE